MRKVFVAATLAALLTGCGAVKLKAGPLGADLGVGPQMGASVSVETVDGKPIAALDVRAAIDGVVTLVKGLF